VVVTGLREPLVLLHRRLIRRRLVLMVVWIAGWAATGFVSDQGWLAIAILVVTGPVLWILVWSFADHGHRDRWERVPPGALGPGDRFDGPPEPGTPRT
jgi:hypothetical protein